MRIWNQKRIAAAIGLTLGSGLALLPLCAQAEEAVAAPMQMFELQGITVEAKRPDWEMKLSPGAVSVVKPEEFKAEQKTLSDLLLTVPGVHIREVNGKGQYTTVTMRGSTAAQVGVFIDGVLSNLGGDSAVDLSTIPIKNVERVEVYRGYIPSRFGGTYIGGVINIVTKKPTDTHINIELGKSSYGGKRGSLEVTTPLGSGTLMVGTNYESSDGDFKYKNYAAARQIASDEKTIADTQKYITDFNNVNIDNMTKGNVISLTQDEIDYYKNNNDAWLEFVRGEAGSGNSFADAVNDNSLSYAEDKLGKSCAAASDILTKMGIKEQYFELGYDERDWIQAADLDWNGKVYGEGIIDESIKAEVIKEYAQPVAEANIERYLNSSASSLDPDKNGNIKASYEKIETYKKKLEEDKHPTRYRKYNDYEKTNTIVKWQNEEWMVKAAYNTLDRHMPDSVWGGNSWHTAMINNAIDLRDLMYYTSRRQKQTNTDLMLQKRQQSGKLEWGWMVDYLHSDKKYRAEHVTYANPLSEWEDRNTPLRRWSEYKSNKYTAQIDGSYKLNDRNMLDFLVNYSQEKMSIHGSGMDQLLTETAENSIIRQMRDRYKQELFNIQLQDSITLDRSESLIFTPSIRYNQSKITGYSNGSRFGDGMFKWIHPVDSQTDGKMTWQLALKKIFNEHFTVRMTGGTYYRLLNMYEIAGDGAGILPAPQNHNGEGAVFPVPEDGKQFDISAIFNRRVFGAENTTTLTYYWRESENMLILTRYGRDYSCYLNDNKGKSNGIEFASNFRWSKFDLDLQVTYLNAKAWNKYSIGGLGYHEIYPTYQPKWEGNVRLTYRPTEKFSVFAEGHYTGKYHTYYDMYDSSKGNPVSSLLVMNGGIKWMPHKNWLLAFGCNDIFDEGPKLKIAARVFGYEDGYVNPEYPIQGRTYYATVRYQF